MRWERLFDDLEAQLEGTRQAGRSEDRKEEERWRVGSLGLRDRLLSCGARPVAVRLAGGAGIVVELHTVGADWLAGDLVGGGDDSVVVPLAAIAAIRLPRPAAHGPVPAGPLPEGPLPAGPSAGGPPSAGPVRQGPAPADPAGLADRGPDSAPRVMLAVVLRDLCRRRSPVTAHLTGRDVHGTIDRVGLDHIDLAVHEPGTPRSRRNVTAVEIVPFTQLCALRF